ncbi:gremlin-2-like [Actinia tenebrosa]|uniref:Gremlin-2-like n=1 Tax=Actinia tenebrosa TaxID=6105 RepID=A0A6P8IBK2_ACTTE|nr:gremlin-2-like [Actinia tenebrosa]
MLVVPKSKTGIIILLIVMLKASLNNGRSLSQDSLYSTNDLESQGSMRKVPLQNKFPLSPKNHMPSGTSVVVQPSSSSATSQKTHNKKFPLKGGSTLLVLPFLRTAIPKDWCKTRKFLQKIHHHGCNSTYITNNVCVGQCLSVFIPNHFVSCSYCTPVEKNVISVELKCPGLQKPVVKKVSIVKSCRCMPCRKNYPS